MRAEPFMPDTAPTTRWLSIVGIGEDGVDGLSAAARGLIGAAEIVYGGHRHRLACRRNRPPGERERHLEIGAAGQALRQQARFGRAAKNKDARHAAA